MPPYPTAPVLTLVAILTACGGGQTSPATKPTPQPVAAAGATTPAFLAGHWRSADTNVSETWTNHGSVLIGVGFTQRDTKTSFEALLIHRERGKLVYTAFPSGARSVDFAAETVGPSQAVFAKPDHDHPKRISYRHAADKLAVTLEGSEGKQTFDLTRAATSPAPLLEAADRAFAADSARRGGAAWATAFLDNGVMWPRGSRKLTGARRIGDEIDKLELGGRKLMWTPTASGMAPSRTLGFTTGRYHVIVEKDRRVVGRGFYLTIWARTPAGWKIAFDTGVAAR